MTEETGEKIIQINIEEEMKTAYIDYSMSVIVAWCTRWTETRSPSYPVRYEQRTESDLR